MAQRQIDCKFGVLCTRLGCPFGHSYGRNVDSQQQAGPSQQQQSGKSPSLVPCKFGAACSRAGCHFMHNAATQTSTSHLSAVPCKFGSRCSRADCCFRHEPPSASQPQPQGAAWNAQGGFQQQGMWRTQQSQQQGVQGAAGPPATRGSVTALSTLANTPCKFGLKCTNPNCHFLHPVLDLQGGKREPEADATITGDEADEEPQDLDEEAAGYDEYGEEEAGFGWEGGYGHDFWGQDEGGWEGDQQHASAASSTPAWEQAYGGEGPLWTDPQGLGDEVPAGREVNRSRADSSWLHNSGDLRRQHTAVAAAAAAQWRQQLQTAVASSTERGSTKIIKADMVGPALIRHLRYG